jgi:hypothetical protein
LVVAVALSVTVPVEELPPCSADGLSESDPAPGAFTVSTVFALVAL